MFQFSTTPPGVARAVRFGAAGTAPAGAVGVSVGVAVGGGVPDAAGGVGVGVAVDGPVAVAWACSDQSLVVPSAATARTAYQ